VQPRIGLVTGWYRENREISVTHKIEYKFMIKTSSMWMWAITVSLASLSGNEIRKRTQARLRLGSFPDRTRNSSPAYYTISNVVCLCGGDGVVAYSLLP
jgi:hypothetical protein